ncbi:MAG: RNA polymerase sigma factor [Planctomycetes bacterium]|nr:RNA polymerase sigma factor [Planctomycetota bacterium]
MTNRRESDTSQRGTRQARLTEVLMREFQRLVRLASGMGLDRSSIEDILQDVSMQALEHDTREMSEPKAVAWLFRTTSNRCKLEFRYRQRRTRLCHQVAQQMIENHDHNHDVGQDAIQAEQIRQVSQSLCELEPNLLQPLVLTYFCDMNSSQISETLHISASTIRTRVQKARLILAQKLIEQGLAP